MKIDDQYCSLVAQIKNSRKTVYFLQAVACVTSLLLLLHLGLKGPVAIGGEPGPEGDDEPATDELLAEEGSPDEEEMELLAPEEQAPEAEEGIDMVEEEDDRISVSVSEGQIQEVLRTMAALRPGTTIMISPEVEGEVSFELQDVPWRTALDLIADNQGLEIIERADNVYLAQPKTEYEEIERVTDLELELYTAEDIKEMPEDELRRLYQSLRPIPETLTVEEMREELAPQAHEFVKHLRVENRRAIEVINQLARQSDVDFIFSTHFDDDPEAETPAPSKDEGPPISLNLRNRHISSVIRTVAEQGGLSTTYQDDTWLVKPMRPEQRELEPLVSETFQVQYINVDEKLVEDLEKISSDRGQIITRGKVITVFDTADRIEQMDRIISDQDVATPQVLIEARFFNLTDTTSHELGIDWRSLGEGMSLRVAPDSLTYDYRHGRILGPIDANDRSFVDPRYLRDGENRLSRSIHPNYLPQLGDRSPDDLPGDYTAIDPRTATLNLPNLEAVLYALDSMDKAEQLSNPKILVSSDEQATIHIGRQEPILRSTVATVDGEVIRTFELDTNFGGETVRVADLLSDRVGTISHDDAYTGYTGYLDLGTKLTVAPSVKTEDEVYIRVIPELINKPGEITVGEDAFRQSFPELFRVRVQTQFNLRSGQTIAIGGLVSEDMTTDQRRVPFLHRLPLAGKLFQYDFEREIRTETIIFLTVHIISPDEMDTTDGMPVMSRGMQSRVNQIRAADEAGGLYDEEARQRELEAAEEAERTRRHPWPFGKRDKGEPEEEAPVPSPEEEPQPEPADEPDDEPADEPEHEEAVKPDDEEPEEKEAESEEEPADADEDEQPPAEPQIENEDDIFSF